MSVLLHFYPGDRVVWMAVGVLIQVTVVSSAALLFARCVAKYKPAVRHSILVCGLLCALVSPALTVVLDVAGFRLVELPLVWRMDWPGPIPRASGGRLGLEIDESRLTAPALPKEAEALDALRKRSGWGGDASRKAERLDVADMLRAAGSALTVFWSGVALILLVRSIRGWCALMSKGDSDSRIWKNRNARKKDMSTTVSSLGHPAGPRHLVGSFIPPIRPR